MQANEKYREENMYLNLLKWEIQALIVKNYLTLGKQFVLGKP